LHFRFAISIEGLSAASIAPFCFCLEIAKGRGRSVVVHRA
jgi:hypothetical protein